MKLTKTAGIFFGLFLTPLWLIAAHADGRGNNFGNAGDPIREVFNAGRVFAIDILGLDQVGFISRQLSSDEQKLYMQLSQSALTQLKLSDHQWGPWQQSVCVRPSVVDRNVVRLAYDRCSHDAPNAFLAAKNLLEMALRTDARLDQLVAVNALTEELTEIWSMRSPELKLEAENFSLSHATITGTWSCEMANQKKIELTVSPEGLVQVSSAIYPGFAPTDRVEFVSFLTLNQTRNQFRSMGVAVNQRAAPGEHDNVILASTCRYPFSADLVPNANGRDLSVQIVAPGRPEFGEGCQMLRSIQVEYKCQRVE